MATFNPVIVPAKALKDGKHKIRISVAHNGQFRYILTDIVINSEKEFKNGQIVKRSDALYLNTKLRGIIQKYQEAYDEIICPEGLTCSELIETMKSQGAKKRITFKEIFDEYLSMANISAGTARTYGICFATLSKCISPGTMMCNLTPYTILSIDKKLRNLNLSPATIRGYMGTLTILIRYAIRSGYVSYKIDPMANYTKPQRKIRDAWLTVEEIKRIRDVDTDNASIILCRDFFLLSYYLGGMNLIDILNIDFKKNSDTLKYIRHKIARKTSSSVEFEIPDEAKEIIARYIGKDGKLVTHHGLYSVTQNFFINHIHRLAEAAGIESYMIYYSARKSFAQHAFNLGVDTSTIHYLLGHSQSSAKDIIFHYLAVSPEMASKALRKVLDNLK